MFKLFPTKGTIFLAFSQIFFGVLGAFFVQIVIIKHSSPAIATINITGLVDSFIQETSKQSLSQIEKKQKVTQFVNQLNQVTNELVKQKHFIILPSEAVIAGSPDLTQEVASEIKRGLSQ